MASGDITGTGITVEKLLIKGKFVCFEKEFYGLFLLYLSFDDDQEGILAAAGSSSFISTYSVDADVEKFVGVVREILDDGEASLDKSREIKALLEAQVPGIKKAVKESIMTLEAHLKDLFKNYLDGAVDVSVGLQRTESYNFVDVEREKEESMQKEQEDAFRFRYKIPPDAKVVGCYPVLSPIKGKSIKEIKEGDLVLSKIDDTEPLGRQIAESYHLYTKERKLKPVIGKTHARISEKGEIVLVLKLASDLIGLAREDEAVKISYISPENIIPRKDLNKKEEKQKENTLIQGERKREQMRNEVSIYLAVGVFIIILAMIFLLVG